MSRRLLLACLLLPCTLQAEQQSPQPIEMPDIRANIIRMLQEGRQEGMGLGEERYGKESNALDTTATQSEAGDRSAYPPAIVPPGEEDLFSIAEEQKKPEHKPEPASATAVTERQSPDPKQQREQPLDLPSKQITIQDIDDLKKLKREFDEAKKRQQIK